MKSDSRPIIFTLCEGDYQLGVAALINSAHNSGFTGRCVVGHRGPRPPWAEWLPEHNGSRYAGDIEIRFVVADPPMHFGYFKPFFACDLRDSAPDASAIIYADPDVIFLAPWEFFNNWIVRDQAVGLCADQNFPNLAMNHPWRSDWSHLVEESGYHLKNPAAPYINSGFAGIPCAHADLWSLWRDVTIAYQKRGEDLSDFRMAQRWRSVVSDQDLLAAALMASSIAPSLLGEEGMGFNADFKFLCHVVEQPKPWRSGRILRALKGFPPSEALKTWRKRSFGPVRAMSQSAKLAQAIDLKIATLIGRFYRR